MWPGIAHLDKQRRRTVSASVVNYEDLIVVAQAIQDRSGPCLEDREDRLLVEHGHHNAEQFSLLRADSSFVEGTEVRKLAELEDMHWWYRERRTIVRRMALSAGRSPTGPSLIAIDVGAAGGGNTRVLRDLGFFAVPIEYGVDGAQIGRDRGLPSIRGDACRLPLGSSTVDLIMAFDVLEHLRDDDQALREMHRVLRPGGSALIAVPADPALWSAHDEAVGHVRRYTREGLASIAEMAGLRVRTIRSWNVLLRPVVAFRRRRSEGSDLEAPGLLVNSALGCVIRAERWLPLGRFPGVSLLLQADRPLPGA